MSKHNAAKFLEAMTNDAALQKQVLAGPANASAWLTTAKGAGHEFSEDDLRAVTERVIDKPVPPEQLFDALQALFGGELDDQSLDHVSGGAGTTASTPTTQAALKQRVATVTESYRVDVNKVGIYLH